MNAEILKAALLGTDRYLPEIPADAPGIFPKIQVLPTDKEDRFLKTAFASLLYEEAGTKPLAVERRLPECPPETQPVVGRKLAATLHSALADKDNVLFAFAVFKIQQQQQVIQPQFVPAILDKALETKTDRQQLLNICGTTGHWLCSLNPKWKDLAENIPNEENAWETGTLEQRKTFFAALRKSDPAASLTLLESTLPKENAANRLAFMQLLNDGLSLADEAFLQKLLTDKSQKVREIVIDMLRRIQGSVLSLTYLEWLVRILRVHEERHLLVTKKKTIIIADDVTPDESLFKAGVEKVSAEKGVPDHVFVAGQLLSAIDPEILAKKLNISDQELIGLLIQHASVKALLPFLTTAAMRFSNRAWALALLHRGDAREIGLLDALETNERLPFYLQFLNGNAANLLTYLLDDSYSLLPLRLAEQLLDHLSKFPFHIAPTLYQQLGLRLPAPAMTILKKYAEDPRQDYQLRFFKNQASEMMSLIELRKNIAL